MTSSSIVTPAPATPSTLAAPNPRLAGFQPSPEHPRSVYLSFEGADEVEFNAQFDGTELGLTCRASDEGPTIARNGRDQFRGYKVADTNEPVAVLGALHADWTAARASLAAGTPEAVERASLAQTALMAGLTVAPQSAINRVSESLTEPEVHLLARLLQLPAVADVRYKMEQQERGEAPGRMTDDTKAGSRVTYRGNEIGDHFRSSISGMVFDLPPSPASSRLPEGRLQPSVGGGLF